MRRLVQAGIVVVLLLTCAGLLLPAVWMVRTASSRIQCLNNCRQITHSWHGYLDTFGHSVAGTYPNPDLPPERRLSWAAVLHPDDQQPDIFRLLDKRVAWDAPANVPHTSVPRQVFVCATASDLATSNQTSYLGVAGVGADAATLPADDPRVGAFGYDRTLKLREFTDGTANTMLLLETRSGGSWAQGGPGTVRGLDPANRPHVGDGRPFDSEHLNGGWFEKKTKIATVVMCDGSVQTIRDSVAAEVLEALATVRGKEDVVFP